MFHFFEAITNKKGDALSGYYCKVIDPSTGNAVSIYSDDAGTPIISDSGIADTALVNTDGNVSFYVDLGTYHLDIYSEDAVTFVRRIENLPMGVNTITLASGSSVNSRGQLAAISGPIAKQSAVLTESGREGTFVFDSSDLSAFVTADPQQGVYIAPSFDTTGASGAWVRQNRLIWRPEWFGAIGDGAANDHAAFRAMGTLGAAIGLLHIELDGSKTYRLGKQNANTTDEFGTGPYYQANENAIEAVNLASLVIVGNGATLKFNDGLKIGGFNPADGTPRTATGNADKALPGFLIHAQGCSYVDVSGIVFDGNSQNLVLGGDAPSAGFYDCRHTGIQINSFNRGALRNCEFQYFVQDGWNVSQSAWGLLDTDEARPFTAENCRSRQCGRCGYAILGGSGVTIINCSSVDPGRAPVTGGGVKGTAPKSAVDVESESLIRNVTFINCRFEQGVSGLYVITCDNTDDTREKQVAFRDCEFVGQLWVQERGFLFDHCRIFGALYEVFGNASPTSDNTVFENCYLTDATKGATPLQNPGASGQFLGTSTPAATGVVFNRCTFELARLKANFIDLKTRNCSVKWTGGTEAWAAGTSVIALGGAGDHEGLVITEAIAANFPVPPFVVSWAAGVSIRRSSLTSASSYLQWLTSGSSGHTGSFDNAIGTPPGDTVNSVAVTNPTMLPRKSTRTQRWDAALTAGIVVALSLTGAVAGDEFLFIRTANATGAFNIAIASLVTLTAAKQWARVTYTGAAWVLSSYGTLP